VRKQVEQPPGDRRDHALHREGGGNTDEHRSRAVPGGEHERGDERLVRQLDEKDDAECEPKCGKEVDQSTLTSRGARRPVRQVTEPAHINY
jgi:hypothetical protein